MDGIAFLTAGGVSLTNVAILAVATFVVSLLVAAAGPTGGMQLAATSATLPGPVVIPIRAWTTGFSALFRAVALHAHVNWRYVRPLVFASAIGAGVGLAEYSSILLPDLRVVVAIYLILSSITELLGRGPRLHFARPQPLLTRGD